MKHLFIPAAALLLWTHVTSPAAAATMTDTCSKDQLLATGCCKGFSFKNPPDGTSLPSCVTTPPPPGQEAPVCEYTADQVHLANPVPAPPATCTATQDFVTFDEIGPTAFQCGNCPSCSSCTGCLKVTLEVVGQNVVITFTGTVPAGANLRWAFFPTNAGTNQGDGTLKHHLTDSECQGQVCMYPISAVVAEGTGSLASGCGKTIYFQAHYAGPDDSGNAQTCKVGTGPWPDLFIPVPLKCVKGCSAYCCCPPPPPTVPCTNPQYQPSCDSCPADTCNHDTCSKDSVFNQDYTCNCCCNPPTPPNCDSGNQCTNPAPGLGCVAANSDCHSLQAKDVCGKDFPSASTCCCTPGQPSCKSPTTDCLVSRIRMRVPSPFGFDTLARSIFQRATSCTGGANPVPAYCPNDPCSGQLVAGCGDHCCCPECTTTQPPPCLAPNHDGPAPTNGACPPGCTLLTGTSNCGNPPTACCCPPDTKTCADTAYASNPGKELSTLLVSGKPCTKAWGWYITSSGTYDVIAGAGQNDIGKGYKVGTATVTISGKCATVSVDLDSAYKAGIYHIHVGCGTDNAAGLGTFCRSPGKYSSPSGCNPSDPYSPSQICASGSCTSAVVIIQAEILKSVPLKDGCTAYTC